MLMVFSVDARHHGVGPVKYSWDPQGNHIASTGSSRVVHVHNRRGKLIDQIVPPSPSPCTLMDWSQNGKLLAIAQANSSHLVLWDLNKPQQHQLIDLACKDISFLQWSKAPGSSYLAFGTNRGIVYIYDHQTGEKTQAMSKHKRKILCGDWNLENKFAFGSEDRQITVCLLDGKMVDQVKIKASPQSITFGGKHDVNDTILSVNMGGKTILLYDLNERENALELAFQPRYGDIVSYRWFGNGFIIAGFSLGYVVIISTHLNEIGQEQYCAKFHDFTLREITYNDANGTVATCGDNCIKVVRMSDWKEIAVEHLDHENHSSANANATNTTQNAPIKFEDLRWTSDGRILSVSSDGGCLYNFMILNSALKSSFFEADSAILAFFKPISPIAMLLTVISTICIVLFGMGVYFEVTVIELLRAMSGFVEGI